MKILVLYHLFFFFTVFGIAQDASITGVIRDADTDEVLPFVNVFLENTTIGDASDDSGRYVLEAVPPGFYNLVVSHIGYEMRLLAIRLQPGEKRELDIKLIPKPLEGEEIEVEAPSPEEWEKMFATFRDIFIGQTSNAKECRILNPYVLDLERHPKTRTLYASTDSTIRLQNDALGYQINIILDHFHWLEDSGSYTVHPRFIEMESENKRQQKQWQKARNDLYKRSLRQFLAYIAQDNLPVGYTVFMYATKPMPSYKELSHIDLNLMREPVIGQPDAVRLEAPLPLKITHQVYNLPSFLELRYGYIIINNSGAYYPIDGIVLTGYWSTLRMADTLPRDFVPD